MKGYDYYVISSTIFIFQVRNLSTSAAMSQMVKPPIQVFGLEGRYACALYSAASKKSSLDAVEKDLKNLQSTMKTNPKIKELVKNPTIKRSIKAGNVNIILSDKKKLPTYK